MKGTLRTVPSAIGALGVVTVLCMALHPRGSLLVGISSLVHLFSAAYGLSRDILGVLQEGGIASAVMALWLAATVYAILRFRRLSAPRDTPDLASCDTARPHARSARSARHSSKSSSKSRESSRSPSASARTRAGSAPTVASPEADGGHARALLGGPTRPRGAGSRRDSSDDEDLAALARIARVSDPGAASTASRQRSAASASRSPKPAQHQHQQQHRAPPAATQAAASKPRSRPDVHASPAPEHRTPHTAPAATPATSASAPAPAPAAAAAAARRKQAPPAARPMPTARELRRTSPGARLLHFLAVFNALDASFPALERNLDLVHLAAMTEAQLRGLHLSPHAARTLYLALKHHVAPLVAGDDDRTAAAKGSCSPLLPDAAFDDEAIHGPAVLARARGASTSDATDAAASPARAAADRDAATSPGSAAAGGKSRQTRGKRGGRRARRAQRARGAGPGAEEDSAAAPPQSSPQPQDASRSSRRQRRRRGNASADGSVDDAQSVSHSSVEDADPATAASSIAGSDTAAPAASLRPPPGLERKVVNGGATQGPRPHTGWRLASLLGEPTASVSSAPATSAPAAAATVTTAPPQAAPLSSQFGLFGAKARESSSSAPRNVGAAAPGHRLEGKEPLWGRGGPGASEFAQDDGAAQGGRSSATEASAGNAIWTAPPTGAQQHQQHHQHHADVERMLDQHTREVAASMFHSVLES